MRTLYSIQQQQVCEMDYIINRSMTASLVQRVSQPGPSYKSPKELSTSLLCGYFVFES